MKQSKSGLRAILKGVDMTFHQCKYAVERFLLSAVNHCYGLNSHYYPLGMLSAIDSNHRVSLNISAVQGSF